MAASNIAFNEVIADLSSVTPTIAHPPHFENSPKELEGLQEFRLIVERLRELGHRDELIRLYTCSCKHEVTQMTDGFADQVFASAL